MKELYNLADCYIFPVVRKDASIELPLSVLEAMSCNLPIVSTRFGGLVDIFEEGGGLFFVDDEKSLRDKIEMIKNRGFLVKTRNKVLPFSWEKVCATLDGIYEQVRVGA